MKKLFSIVAAIAMLASTMPTVSFAATYSDELQGAYDYAYGIGITTQSSVDGANMYGNLIRSHMAKMMVNYAKEVLGKTADTSATCSFTDISNESAELQGYIKDACQMGLMGVGITAFRPNDSVTRAEFGTVLSRALWGDKNNGGEPYYVNHLNALKDAGIMTNISNPSMKEVRGYVMLMMQRADESNVADNKPAVCSTPENVLACSLGLESCPAECTTSTEEPTETKAGTVKIALAADEEGKVISVPKVGTVTAATVKVSASSSNVKVYSFDLERTGLGNRSDVDRIYFEKNGVRVSGRTSLTTDGKATVSFSPALEVKQGSTESVDLIVVFSGSVGSEHAFKFNAVDTSAESEDMGSLVTATLRTTDYTVGKVNVDVVGSNTTHKYGDKGLELGRFKLTNLSNDDKEIKVKSITFRNAGDGDIENSLENIALYRDSDKVSTDAIINGKDVTFVLNSKLTANQNATYYIRGDVTAVENTNGDSYRFELKNAQDLVAEEVNTNFRISVVTDSLSSFSTLSLNTYSIEGGDITFEKDASISSTVTASPSATDVVLMKGKITVKQPITLEDAKLPISISPAGIVNKITLKIGGASSTFTPASNATGFTGEFDGSWTITKDATVYVMVDIKSTATGGTVKLNSNLNLNSFTTKEYVSNSNTVTGAGVGSISSATLTVKAAKLTLSKNDGLSNRSVVKGSDNVTLLGAKFSTTEDKEIVINNFDLTGSNTAFNDKITATLYVNGVATKSTTFRSGKFSFSSLNIKVKNGQDADIRIEGDFVQDATGAVAFTLTNVDATDYNSQVVTVTPVLSAAITMTDAGSVELVKNSSAASASLLVAGSTDVELAKFNVVAKDDSVKLTDLYFTNAGTLDLSDRIASAKLYYVSGTDLVKIADGNIVSEAKDFVVFENLDSQSFVVNPTNNRTLVVKADVNNALYTGDLANNTIQLTLTGGYSDTETGTLQGARFVSESNGETVATNNTVAMTMGNTHMVVRGMPVVAKKETTSSYSRLMNFSVTANGNRIYLTGAKFELLNNANASAVVSIYKTSVSSSNLLGTGVVTAGVVTFANAEEIAAGTTLDLIAEISGYTPTGNAASNYAREFKITDVTYQQIFNDGNVTVGSVAPYVNAGNFPLTITYQP